MWSGRIDGRNRYVKERAKSECVKEWRQRVASKRGVKALRQSVASKRCVKALLKA